MDLSGTNRPIPVIVFTVSVLLLNRVTTTSDQKDIHVYELPDVTLECDSYH